MLILTPQGLYCPAGNFHIDPKGAVENAVVTHAHSDHARRGAKQYYCTTTGVSLLKARLGKNIQVKDFAYAESFFLGPVKISFHSAGHILGSSQVRMEYNGEVWVASGDYKREFDPTCEPFESVSCDVFVTEATFGTPGYTWPKKKDLGRDIADWWDRNTARGVNSVLFAYSLGKAQRVLGLLEPYALKPVYTHPATTAITDCYRHEGVSLADTLCLSTLAPGTRLEGELLLVPQAFLKSPQAEVLGDNFETAFASGWMSKNTQGYSRGFDHGFVLSDHADWNDLLRTIVESQAQRVYVQHRGVGALVRHLKKMGIQAFPEEDLIPKNSNQLSLF